MGENKRLFMIVAVGMVLIVGLLAYRTVSLS